MSERIAEQFSKASVSDDGALEQLLCQGARLQHRSTELRAHEIFLERGGIYGHELQDWLEAKRELFGAH